MNFSPPQVSRHFRYDWQYAVASSRLPLLRPASLVIALMPLLPSFSSIVFSKSAVSVPTSFWVTWFASVAFLASWSIIQLRCPKLIREYRDFGEFASQQHSHRWIVWLFYDHLRTSASLEPLIREALLKGVALKTTAFTTPEEFRVCPYLVRSKSGAQRLPFGEPMNPVGCEVLHPLNIGRDLYLPAHCDGQRVLIFLQEDDPKLSQKEKELFWILFTKTTKERPSSRLAFWLLFFASVLLLTFNVLSNVVAALW